MSGEKPLGVGDLPPAVAVGDTDTSPLCQEPNGCFANDRSVTLKGVTQRQLAAYYRTQFDGAAPLTYDLVNGVFGLATDPSLIVVDGLLGVSPAFAGGGGGSITVPNSALLSGNGTALGSVALGPGLSMAGAFPNQVLTATAAGAGTVTQIVFNAPLTGGTVTTTGTVGLGQVPVTLLGTGTTTPTASNFLRGDGTWQSASGSTGLSGMTAGQIPIAFNATTVTSSANLSGHVVSAPTTLATTIQANVIATTMIVNNAVTYGKLQAGTTAVLLGTGGSGTAFQEITLGSNLSFAGTVLNAAATGGVSGTAANNQLAVGTGTNVIGPLAAGTTNTLLKGNTGAAPSWGAVDLATVQVTGDLPHANMVQVTAARLIGNAGGTLADRGEIALGSNLNFSGGNTLNAVGSVSSVTLSSPGGIFAVSGTNPITGSSTFGYTTTGTSGGIPYFSTTAVLSTSALLTARAVMLGGGAGTAPRVVAALGNSGDVLTSQGAGADPIFAPGGTGSGTVSSGTTNQLAVYTAATTVGTPGTGTLSPGPLLISDTTLPALHINNTTATSNTGLWRLAVGTTGNINLQNNTAAAGNFSTFNTGFQITQTGGVSFPFGPVTIASATLPSFQLNNTTAASNTGLWRLTAGTTGNINFQNNTAPAGDFTTFNTGFQIAQATLAATFGGYVISGAPTAPGGGYLTGDINATRVMVNGVAVSAGGGITDAPSDDTAYTRRDTAWVNNPFFTAATISSTAAGTITPTAGVLIINRNTVAVTPPAGLGVSTHVIGANTSTVGMVIDGFAGVPGLTMRRANTSAAAPSNIANTNVLGNILWQGYAGGAYPGTNVARIQAAATEAFSATNNQATQIEIATVPGGGVSATLNTQAIFGPGLQVGAPTAPSGGMLVGDVNVASRFLINGVVIGFAESVGWIAGANPNNAIVFVNGTGRTVTVVGIKGVLQVANSAGFTLHVWKATSATAALGSGTQLSTAAFTGTGTAGTVTTMLSGGTTTLAADDRVGIVLTGTTPDTSVATITVYMV